MQQKVIPLALLLLTPLASLHAAPLPTAAKPNIVFLLADDLGDGDLHCYGHPYASTPHLDQLAAEGTRYMQFYATGVTCCPARTGLMTSRFPAYPANGGFADRITVTELLKKAGYQTGHFGKWHIGPDQKPGTYGIDSVGVENDEGHINKRTDMRGRDAHIYDQAIHFIEENKDRPFYVNVWGHISHHPVNPPQALVDQWKNLKVKDEDFPEPMREKLQACREAGGNVDDAMRRYLADVWSLDDSVGRLLKRLDELGLSENTIVVFSSDQGSGSFKVPNEKNEEKKSAKKAAKLERHGDTPPAADAAADASSDENQNLRFNLMGYNGTHRGGKHTNWEGGVRVPFIVRWPGHVTAGRTDETSVISGADWLPTLCAIAGVKIDANNFDGEDVSTAWLGKEYTRSKPLLWKVCSPGSEAVIREGQWKLFSPTRKRGEVELYDVPADPFEKNNVAATHPGIVKTLQDKLDVWRATLPKTYLKAGDKQD